MFYNEKEPLLVEDIEKLVNPNAKIVEAIAADEVYHDRSVEDRIAFLEETLFSLVDNLRESAVLSKNWKRYNGFPVGLKLYSRYSPKTNDKKTLLVTENSFLLSSGIQTNSLQSAMELVAPKSEDPWVFWRLGGHRGPSVGEVFGHMTT